MMQAPFCLTIVTLFPDLFPGPLAHSMTGRALANNLWAYRLVNIRDFTTDKHKTVDDTPYGGGAGMVMRADIVAQAIRHAKKETPDAPVVYLSPAGKPFKQPDANRLAAKNGVILLCGHYEGIDERVLDSEVDERISIGDYVLTGGEIPALVLADSIIRQRPGVLGNNAGLHEESFSLHDDERGIPLLEYAHYTRPDVWEGKAVPEVLKSGHHGNIERWRKEQALKRTQEIRPDLLKKHV